MTMKLVERIELATSSAFINFASIPQDATDLYLVVSARGTTTSAYDGFTLEPNGGVPSAMNVQIGQAGPARESSSVFNETNRIKAGLFSLSNSTANTFASTEIKISNYTSTSYKTFTATSVDASETGPQWRIGGRFQTTTAITSLRLNGSTLFGGSFAAGSSATLYSITKGETTLLQPKATGGTIAYFGGYWYHTFRSSGTFRPNQAITGAQVLIVAGGGGSGQAFAGGGGAGGVLTGNSIGFDANTNYAVAVGGGGAGTNGTRMAGTNGSNSSLGSATANGGGTSGYWNSAYFAPSAGGSGGGGGGNANSSNNFQNGAASNQTAPAGYIAYGNAGGKGVYTSGGYGRGGGGGGAGQVGGDTLNTGTGAVNGGLGGNGILSSISGTPTYYGGGGGGMTDGGGTAPGAIGGLGGGGKGWDGNIPGTAGTVNTGGGGGGSGNSSIQPGMAGGSGIVIVRYQ